MHEQTEQFVDELCQQSDLMARHVENVFGRWFPPWARPPRSFRSPACATSRAGKLCVRLAAGGTIPKLATLIGITGFGTHPGWLSFAAVPVKVIITRPWRRLEAPKVLATAAAHLRSAFEQVARERDAAVRNRRRGRYRLTHRVRHRRMI
jgi:hypothetical protein